MHGSTQTIPSLKTATAPNWDQQIDPLLDLPFRRRHRANSTQILPDVVSTTIPNSASIPALEMLRELLSSNDTYLEAANLVDQLIKHGLTEAEEALFQDFCWIAMSAPQQSDKDHQHGQPKNPDKSWHR